MDWIVFFSSMFGTLAGSILTAGVTWKVYKKQKNDNLYQEVKQERYKIAYEIMEILSMIYGLTFAYQQMNMHLLNNHIDFDVYKSVLNETKSQNHELVLLLNKLNVLITTLDDIYEGDQSLFSVSKFTSFIKKYNNFLESSSKTETKEIVDLADPLLKDALNLINELQDVLVENKTVK